MQSSKAPTNVLKDGRRAKKRQRRTFKVTRREVGDEKKKEDTRKLSGGVARSV